MEAAKALCGRDRQWNAKLSAVMGLGLGLVAFIPDLVPDNISQILVPVVSSGFAWGFLALTAGYVTPQPGRAPVAGIVALTVATLVYYLMILLVSQRWNLTADQTEDGKPAPLYGLASVARALGFWLAASIIAGAVMGRLGNAVRWGSARRKSVAAGIALGLLAGEGAYVLFHGVVIWVGPLDSFYWSRMVSAIIQIILAVGAVVLMLRAGQRVKSWRLFMAASGLSIVISIALWHIVQSFKPWL